MLEREVFVVSPMAPDLGLYAGADEASDLCKGFIRVGGQPMLVPQWRDLPDNEVVALLGSTINGVSQGFDRMFLAASNPKLYDWAISGVSNTLVDRTPATAAHMVDGPYTFARWGTTFLACPHSAASSAEILQYDPSGAATFERFITSTEKPVGKFMGRIRNHMLVANCDENGYSPALGAEGNRFHWCGRLNVLDWSDPDKLAGYGYITDKPISNDITEFVVWEDFGVFFTRGAVYRLSFVGGDARFELDGIGEGHETVFGSPVLRVGRDGFYISNSGPRVIINGERTDSLGMYRVARSLMDRSFGASWALKTLKGGGYDRLHGTVGWVYEAEDGVWWVLVYELDSQQFDLIELGDGATNEWGTVSSVDDYFAAGGDTGTDVSKHTPVELETTVLSDHGKPFWNLMLVPSGTAGNWKLFGQTLKLADASLRRDTYAIEYLSKAKRLGGGPSHVHGVRAIWNLNETMADDNVALTVTLEASEDRHFRSANIRSSALVSSAADSIDFLRSGLPAKGLFWRVRASIPAQQQVLTTGDAVSTHYQLKELTAFELEYKRSGQRA